MAASKSVYIDSILASDQLFLSRSCHLYLECINISRDDTTPLVAGMPDHGAPQERLKAPFTVSTILAPAGDRRFGFENR